MRGWKSGLLGLVLVCACFAPARAGDGEKASSIDNLLPLSGEVDGWVRDGEPEYAAGEDLFYLINGGAAIYREYGFREAVYQTYTSADGRSISLEIYAMDTPEAAFGIYTFKTGRDGGPAESVHAGWLESYYLNFWKSSYQVTVVALEPGETPTASLIELAEAVDARIEAASPVPAVTAVLPRDKLLPNGVTYLRGNLALFNKYLFDRANVFGVREGVIGEYEDYAIFIFAYEDPEEAKEWFGSAREFLRRSERFKNFADAGDRFQFDDSREEHLTVTTRGKWILIVKGKSGVDADGLILRCERSLK